MGVLVNIRIISENIHGLPAELPEHGGIGPGKFGLHRMRCLDGKVIFPDPRSCIREIPVKIFRKQWFHPDHGFVILKVHDQLPVVVTSFAQRTYQTIAGGRLPVTGNHHFNLIERIKMFRDPGKVLLHLMRASPGRYAVLDVRLIVVEVGEESFFDISEIQGGSQQKQCRYSQC